MNPFFLSGLLGGASALLPFSQSAPAQDSPYIVRVPVLAAEHAPSTTSFDFGTVIVGTQASRGFTFTNRSAKATTLGAVQAIGKARVLEYNCTGTLLPNESCALTLGWSTSCAVVNGGAVKCWGYNGNYGLGTGNTLNSYFVPVQVSGLDAGASSVSISTTASCAKTSTGVAKCWGLNKRGEAGVGSILPVAVPISVKPQSNQEPLARVFLIGALNASSQPRGI